MEAKTKDGHTTVTMTDTEADELFWELSNLVKEDASWKLWEALAEDNREDGRESCSGGTDSRGILVHDGDTCPIHEAV